MERLVWAWTDAGVQARVVSLLTPERWRRAMSGGSFGRLLARLMTLTLYPLVVVLEARLRGPGIWVPTTNPFTLPWWCVATRWFHGRPVVPLVYDLYPDALEAAGASRGGVMSRLFIAMNRWWLRRADGVVYIGDRMARHANERYGEPAHFTVIETGAAVAELDGAAAVSAESGDALAAWCQDRLILSYVGNLGVMHDWETLAEGLPEFAARAREEGLRIGVVLAASGPHAGPLAERLAPLGDDALRVTGPLDDAAWAQLLVASDVSIVTLLPSARHTCVPSKAFSAAAAGCALVAVTDPDSDLADLVTDEGCGAVIPPGDAASLTETLLQWARDRAALSALQGAATRAARERFDMPVLSARWDTFLDEVMAARSGRRSTAWVKRMLDMSAAAIGLFVLAPPLGCLALAVRLQMGSPVIFRQERPGLGGKAFRLAKFRTMRDPRPGEEGPEHDGARITRLGRFMRATSLDELPTLYNVLRGDMSLVGPRPLLMRYLDRYTPTQARRHDVVPGITGWAQVNGRNALGWEEKFAHDVWYVDHRSLWLDLKILFMTLGKVVRRSGISQDGHATMPEFMGRETLPQGHRD